jgi:hypothetical protein
MNIHGVSSLVQVGQLRHQARASDIPDKTPVGPKRAPDLYRLNGFHRRHVAARRRKPCRSVGCALLLRGAAPSVARAAALRIPSSPTSKDDHNDAPRSTARVHNGLRPSTRRTAAAMTVSPELRTALVAQAARIQAGEQIDEAERNRWFAAIVGCHGWPDRRTAGVDGAHAAFVLAARCPTALQRKWLPQIRSAVQYGAASQSRLDQFEAQLGADW